MGYILPLTRPLGNPLHYPKTGHHCHFKNPITAGFLTKEMLFPCCVTLVDYGIVYCDLDLVFTILFLRVDSVLGCALIYLLVLRATHGRHVSTVPLLLPVLLCRECVRRRHLIRLRECEEREREHGMEKGTRPERRK